MDTSRVETAKTLPKILPGTVHAQWVRCGKPGCRCEQGETHGPYYYRFWREDGRLRKQYVSRHDVQRIRDMCDQRRKDHKEIASTWEKWQKLTQMLREAEAPLKKARKTR